MASIARRWKTEMDENEMFSSSWWHLYRLWVACKNAQWGSRNVGQNGCAIKRWSGKQKYLWKPKKSARKMKSVRGPAGSISTSDITFKEICCTKQKQGPKSPRRPVNEENKHFLARINWIFPLVKTLRGERREEKRLLYQSLIAFSVDRESEDKELSHS